MINLNTAGSSSSNSRVVLNKQSKPVGQVNKQPSEPSQGMCVCLCVCSCDAALGESLVYRGGTLVLSPFIPS